MSPHYSVAELNDLCRATMITGRAVLTEGVRALADEVREAIITRVRAYDAFTPDNDPHGERDFGMFTQDGAGVVFWAIAYYDRNLRFHSPDPADPAVTRRVLTIMLAHEW